MSNEDVLEEDAKGSHNVDDDLSVPFEAVMDAIHSVLGKGAEEMFDLDPDGGVVLRAEAEEALVEIVEGVIIDVTSSVAKNKGRRCCK